MRPAIVTQREWASRFLATGLSKTHAHQLASELPQLRTYAQERTLRALEWRRRLKPLQGGTTARNKRLASLRKSSARVRQLGESIQRESERARRTLGREVFPTMVVGCLHANRHSVATFTRFLESMVAALEMDRYPFKQGQDIGKRFLIEELRFFFQDRDIEISARVGSEFYKVVSVVTGKKTPNLETLKPFQWTDVETETRRARKTLK